VIKGIIMKINLISDCKYHNLALMKLSTFHKHNDDQVYLNGVGQFDMTIGSWLFTWSQKHPCDFEGGPGIDPTLRLGAYDNLKPDYDLFPVDYSLGYTWEYCPRKCPFCVVPKMNPPKKHHSIWDFHNPKFKKICLLNNNTFSDPQWRETFEEIWDADLTVRDENGYDLRLIDEEKAEALKKTKFDGYIHYAWDLMENEKQVLRGLKLAPKGIVYVLVGFDENNPDIIRPLHEEDFYRCQKIHDMGFDPYVMPYNRGTSQLRNFKRFIDTRMYRKHKPTPENKGEAVKEAWKDYTRK